MLQLQAPEPARLHLEPDDEEQEDDAELSHVQDLLAVRDAMEDRPDDDARRQISEHRAEPQLLEDRRRDDRAAEQQDRFGEKGIGCGHASSFFQWRGAGKAASKRIAPATLMLSGVHNKWNAKERPNHVL